jgi:hypothetical protein
VSDQHVGVPSGWTEKELATLGRIVFNFTGLNWCAERLLAGFMPGGATALIALVPMPTSDKLKRLRVKAETDLGVASPEREKLLTWVDGVEVLNDERNGMIHSAWVQGVRDGAMTRIWPRVIKKQWEAQSTEVDLPRLDELADLIRDATEAAAVQISVALASCKAWHGQPLA